MGQKTILEELLESSPEEKKRNNMLDSAFKLSSKGKYDEAAELFDELLAGNPEDREAATGKKLNERRKSLDSRINRLSGAQTDEPTEKKKERFSLLRSQKTLTALVIAFVLLCALAAAMVGIGGI